MTVRLERAPYVLLRALAATVLVMTGAVGAHSWAGGHLPGLPAMLALTGVVLGGGLLALSGTVGPRLLLVGVALAQTCLHGMFGLLATPSEHAAHTVTAGTAGTAGADPTAWSWQMLVAHLAGTALTALAWWLCDRGVRAVLVAVRLRPAYAARRRPLLDAPVSPARPSLVHLLTAPRRGPPVAARCA